jgi:hypothetical protein
MPAEGNGQFESLWDASGTWLFNVVDAYGWVLPATLLTLLFLGAVVLLCWWLEDLPFDLPVLEGPFQIFQTQRKGWRERRKGITLGL